MHDILTFRERRGLGFPDAEKLIKKAARTALKCQGVDADCVINVMLTDDAGIRAVNNEQRGVDSATDVLSFPLNELEEGVFDADICEYDFEREKIMLGDMVVSLERCAAQAREFGHGFDRELSYLTVHSVLHLLGYDHLDEGERKARMREREEAVMEKLALKRRTEDDK